jgi:hypothetical protein
VLYVLKILAALIVFIAVAELARQHPKWGGLISALPWITLLVIVTRYQVEQATASELSRYLWATFWFILPTLLFVGMMATLLDRGFAFYASLGLSILIAAMANGMVAYWLT